MISKIALQTQLPQLTQPEGIVLIGLFALVIYLGLRVRSIASFGMIAVTGFVLMFVLLGGLGTEAFLLLAGLSIFIVAISGAYTVSHG